MTHEHLLFLSSDVGEDSTLVIIIVLFSALSWNVLFYIHCE